MDIWKKNVMKNLESRSLSYVIVGEFLADLKKEFSGRDNETMKIAELKKVKQGNKTMEEFIQELRRAARENDLFVKPEKCVWKVREVGFLGVIIGEDRVRMEKEKVWE